MWPTSGWMMSAAWSSNSSRNSMRSWMRSPVAIGSRVCAATFASALRFSGGHRLLQPARVERRQHRWRAGSAVAGQNRPCISSISSASGPIASRTASISETECSVSRVVQLEVAGAERVDLQRPVAALDDLLRRLVVLLRGALDGVPAVGVRLDPVA